jgi:hypothetical protein
MFQHGKGQIFMKLGINIIGGLTISNNNMAGTQTCEVGATLVLLNLGS